MHAAGKSNVRQEQAVQQNKQSLLIVHDVKALMMQQTTMHLRLRVAAQLNML
jgi:hypothetical protein